MIKEAIDIFKSYKQIKGAEQYVQGLRPLYEEIYKVLPKSNRTVDVGCAYGIMSLACKLRGDRVDALDMTDKFTNLKMFYDNGISFRKYDIEKTPDEHGSGSNFPYSGDLIILTEVLEHFNSNPLPSIKKIYACLNRGGHVVCSTPAKELWGTTENMNAGMGKKKGLWNDLDSWRDIPEYKGKWKDQHTFHYDQFELVSLFTEAGFEVEDVKIISQFSHLLVGRKK